MSRGELPAFRLNVLQRRRIAALVTVTPHGMEGETVTGHEFSFRWRDVEAVKSLVGGKHLYGLEI